MSLKKTFSYTYELKENKLTGTYKIVRYKWNLKNQLIGKATIYKNLDKTTAEEHKYFLDRGKQPL